jgi:hypothetical protein
MAPLATSSKNVAASSALRAASLEQTGRHYQKQPATAPHLSSATLSQLELHSLSQHCAWPH